MENALRIAFPNAEYACGVLHLSYLSVQPGPPLFPSLIAPEDHFLHKGQKYTLYYY